MTRQVLILRPEPGASRTAERARSLELDPITAPLFKIRQLPWTPPESAGFDAVMLTSANAAREAGGGLTSLLALPCYCVGESSAAAAREAGFADVRTGPSNAEALIALMAGEGVGRALHLCGCDRLEPGDGPVSILQVPVYSADPIERLSSEAQAAIGRGAVVLLHSPRAASLFARLVGAGRNGVTLAAISRAAADSAGAGFARVVVAARPRDEALLELAVKLCQTAAE